MNSVLICYVYSNPFKLRCQLQQNGLIMHTLYEIFMITSENLYE